MSSLSQAIKRGVQRLFGVTLFRKLPHGLSDCYDIAAIGLPIKMVFDVGAHDGSSAKKFLRAFPGAEVHCFEPVEATFALLRDSVRGIRQIHCHQLALGSSAGTAQIYHIEHSTASSLVRPDWFKSEETIRISTLDEMVQQEGIDRIDLLKVDAEGFDLEVLRGAAQTLSARKIAIVLVETTFTAGNPRFALFDSIRDFLADYGFSLYGIYDQTKNWTGEKQLWYVNACFVQQAAVSPEANANQAR